MATGVASPSAHGQLMTRTEIPRASAKPNVLSGQKPDNGCDDRNRDDCRYKYAGNPVCDLSNRRFGGRRIADHFDDLGECGVFAYTGCLAADKSGLIDGGSGNKIT